MRRKKPRPMDIAPSPLGAGRLCPRGAAQAPRSRCDTTRMGSVPHHARRLEKLESLRLGGTGREDKENTADLGIFSDCLEWSGPSAQEMTWARTDGRSSVLARVRVPKRGLEPPLPLREPAPEA